MSTANAAPTVARPHETNVARRGGRPAARVDGNPEPEDLVRIGPLNAGGGND